MHLLSQSQLLLLICAQISFRKPIKGEAVEIVFTQPNTLGNNPSSVQPLHSKLAYKTRSVYAKVSGIAVWNNNRDKV